MKRSTLVLLIGYTFLVSCNREKVTLRVNLEPGDKHYTTMEITTEVMNKEFVMKFEMTDEVKSKDENGLHDMIFTYRRIYMKIDDNVYDSDDPSGRFGRLMDDQMGFFMHKPMAGLIHPNALTEIVEDFTKWEGYHELNPQMIRALDEAFSQQNIEYPKEEIAEGGTWTATIERKSNGMVMDMNVTYTLEDVSEDEIEISLVGEIASSSRQNVEGEVTGKIILDGKTHYNKSVEMNIEVSAQGITVPVRVVIETEKM